MKLHAFLLYALLPLGLGACATAAAPACRENRTRAS